MLKGLKSHVYSAVDMLSWSVFLLCYNRYTCILCVSLKHIAVIYFLSTCFQLHRTWNMQNQLWIGVLKLVLPAQTFFTYLLLTLLEKGCLGIFFLSTERAFTLASLHQTMNYACSLLNAISDLGIL